MTFEQYIEDHSSPQMRAYLTGYTDAIHNNAYFFGGCPKKLQYRPYNEYMQHIDIYIAQKTKERGTNKEIFLQKNIEPFLTEVILKYIDCNNPESIQLQDQPKIIQVEIREISRDTIQKTKKYQSVDEREMEFQYNEYLNRLKNPPKIYKQKSRKSPEKLQENKKIYSEPIADKLKKQAEEAPKNEQKTVEIIESKQETQSKSILESLKEKASNFPFVGTEKHQNQEETPPKAQIKDTKQSPVASPKPEPIPQTQTSAPVKPSIDLSIAPLKINEHSAKTTQKIEPLQISQEEYKLKPIDINLDNLKDAKLP